MKRDRIAPLLRNSCAALLLLMAGCLSTAGEPPPPAHPFEVVMKAPDCFVVNEKEVDLAHLVKALKRNKASMDAPLLIEMPEGIPFETVKAITRKLASAGYKPVFRNPRHAKAMVGGKRALTAP